MTGSPAHDWVGGFMGGNKRSLLSTALDILFHYYEVLIQLFSELRGLKDSVRLQMRSSSEQ